VAPTKPLHVFLLALSADYSKLFSLYFKFSGEPCIVSKNLDQSLTADMYRVCMGPGKPGKSWNFVVAFSRTGKSWKKATGPG